MFLDWERAFEIAFTLAAIGFISVILMIVFL